MGENEGNNKKPSNGQEAWWQPALLMFGRLSSWIIGPVIVGALLGQWLDRKYSTDPWLFLASVGVAFIISMIGLVRNTLDEIKKAENYKKEINDKDKK